MAGLLAPLPQRSAAREILDADEQVSQEALHRSLRAMARVNRVLGGIRSLLAHLRPLVRELDGRTLEILDVGVGLGEVPRALDRALERRGVRVRWTGVELSRRVLHLARKAGDPHEAPRFVQADGLALPFPDDAFHVVLSTLTLHHLDQDEALTFLVEGARVASRAVLVSDLERHPLHYLGARFLAATWWRWDPVTRVDGPLSVLRAYTRHELGALGNQAPFREVCVHRHFPFRLVLEGRP